jgi:mono/diheme cytochrome c family protein
MPALFHTRRFTSGIATIAWLLVVGRVTASDMSRENTELRQRLSETGLFVAGSTSEVQSQNLAFAPQYPLWSDGAIKRRWIYLPPGTSIDATNPDAWEFPRGTKFWKEFAHGHPIETRFIERLNDGSWRYATYVWNAQGTDAELASPKGMAIAVAGKGRYDVPAEDDCRACHEGNAIPVLGFSALQLSPDRDPLAPHAEVARAEHVDLRTLLARGLLKNLPQSYIEHAPRIDAATPTARAVLGYLHGNCGHCHNNIGSLAPLELSLAQSQSSRSADALRTLIGESSRFRTHDVDQRVAPGRAASSALVVRMRSRNPLSQMPPIGTSVIDVEALALIERWINNDLLPQENNP